MPPGYLKDCFNDTGICGFKVHTPVFNEYDIDGTAPNRTSAMFTNLLHLSLRGDLTMKDLKNAVLDVFANALSASRLLCICKHSKQLTETPSARVFSIQAVQCARRVALGADEQRLASFRRTP